MRVWFSGRMTAFQAVDESSILSTRTVKGRNLLAKMIRSFKNKIPEPVSQITSTLKKANFEAFLVGGCVRDLLLNKTPKDWDITTNATPEQIISLFPNTFYENKFGTVGVVNKEVTDETLKIVEVTPYRSESGYADNRHPDQVVFEKDIKEDLKRRDFTINAMAYDVETKIVVDIFGGENDLEHKLINTVGNPDDRFMEDALRMVRAIRLSGQLGFEIEEETLASIKKNRELLKNISKERIRDELIKILISEDPKKSLFIAKESKIMAYIIAELEETYDVAQNKAHSFNVFEHLLRSMQYAAHKGHVLEVRLAALLHDIGKPRSKRWSETTGEPTFYGHDVIGARMTEKILERLKFPRKTIDDVVRLVRWHMFFSDTEKITMSAVRRLIANVGKEYIWDLVNLRICDRVGTGRPKETPYRLRKFNAMIDEALTAPVSVGMLKIGGREVIAAIEAQPSPRIGFILHALLEEVLEDPTLNTKEYLEKRAKELNMLTDEELKKAGDSGKEKKELEEEKKVSEIRKKHWVQ